MPISGPVLPLNYGIGVMRLSGIASASNLSAEAERAKVEAIHRTAYESMDCFVASAPRNDGG
jgi:hypothetical protein